MKMRYMIWLAWGLGTLLLLFGCSDANEESKANIASYESGLKIEKKEKNQKDDQNDDQDEEDGGENNDTNDTGDDPVTLPERIVPNTKQEPKRQNWYIALSAEAVAKGLSYRGAKLGELEEENATQKHALKALNPFGGNFVDIVFEDPEGVLTGTFATYFLHTQPDEERRWRMTVRSSDADATIVLAWRGVMVLTPFTDAQGRYRYREAIELHHPLWRQMKLVDLKTQTEIPAQQQGKLLSYRFAMEGETERTFEWVVTKEAISQTFLSSEQVRSLSAQSVRQNRSKSHEKRPFDLVHPPEIQGFP